MFMRILHSTPARLVRALAGTWLFVEGSVAQGVAGIALMAAGTLLVVTAGADVCVLDAVFGRRATHALVDNPAEAPVSRAA